MVKMRREKDNLCVSLSGLEVNVLFSVSHLQTHRKTPAVKKEEIETYLPTLYRATGQQA